MEYFALFIISITLVCCSCSGDADTAWDSVIDTHLEKYPEMQAGDLYKLLYQAVLGPGHLGTELSKITKYLELEMSQITADPNALLIENITPDSSFVRINLYRYKSENYSVDDLAALILESSDVEADAKEQFIRVWQNIARKVEKRRFIIDPDKFRVFNQFVVENNYPVIHHSETYIQRYAPAYRVVSLNAWYRLIAD